MNDNTIINLGSIDAVLRERAIEFAVKIATDDNSVVLMDNANKMYVFMSYGVEVYNDTFKSNPLKIPDNIKK